MSYYFILYLKKYKTQSSEGPIAMHSHCQQHVLSSPAEVGEWAVSTQLHKAKPASAKNLYEYHLSVLKES